MRSEWTGEIVKQMHIYEIPQRELAKACGWSSAYVGMILNGVRETAGGRAHIEKAMAKLKEARR